MRILGIDPGVAELVVHFLLLWITEYVVGFVYFPEFICCCRIACIGIRMILLGKLTVCFFNSVFVCVSVNTQNFIIISF